MLRFPGKAHLIAARERREAALLVEGVAEDSGGARGQRDGGPPAEYLEDVRSGKSQMRRPTGENVSSWRWVQPYISTLQLRALLESRTLEFPPLPRVWGSVIWRTLIPIPHLHNCAIGGTLCLSSR